MSLTKTALHSLKWSMLAAIASKAIGPIVFLVLARILLPEDFGVIAAATVVISFSQVFWDAGLAQALVQKQDRVNESANVVFWLNSCLGVAMLLVLLVLADAVAAFFHDHRIGQVVRVLSLQLPLAAVASVHTALFQKNFHFKKLFWIRLIATSIPALASLPLAMLGAGYWALVAGTLTGQVALTLSLWLMSSWRPTLGFDRALARQLWRFGRWAMLSALLAWFYLWMDAIVVGHYLGPHDMGLYRTGNTLVIMVFGLIFSPVLPVLYSILSRAQHDLPKLREAFLFVIRGVALVGFPVALTLVAVHEPLEEYLFGPSWAGVGVVVSILALAHALAWVVTIPGEVYRAAGKPHLETLSMAVSAIVYLAVYIATIRYGLLVFVLARLCLVVFGFAFHVFISWKYIDVPLLRWARALCGSMAGATVMCLILYSFSLAINQGPLLYAAQLAGGLLGYIAVILMLESAYIKQAKSNILKPAVAK